MVFGRSRGSRGLRLRPVNRIKHVVDIQGALVVNTQVNETIIDTKDAPVLANVKEVQTGATINGIFLKVEALATSSAVIANFYLIVFKSVGGNIGTPAANAVGSDDNKRFVIHQEMVMFQKQTNSNPRTVFVRVIVLPRGLRRMGPNDLVTLGLRSPGVTSDYCIQTIYKEFR